MINLKGEGLLSGLLIKRNYYIKYIAFVNSMLKYILLWYYKIADNLGNHTPQRGDKTMSMFMDAYVERARRVQSVLCVGIDIEPSHVPPMFGGDGSLEGTAEYIKAVIRLAAENAAVVKFQKAYYEAMGPEGLEMLIRLIEYAHLLELQVILDAKFSDIGKTMAMYGAAAFDIYGADACTFTPYLGGTFLPCESDISSWILWLDQGKGIISMIRTSNQHAATIQDARLTDGRLVYQMFADLAYRWASEVADQTGGRGMVAGVVGATVPEQATGIRERVGNDFSFLIPGFGAQGGVATDAVAGFPDSGAPNCFVNSSRGITMKSWQDEDGDPKSGNPMDYVAAAIDEANAALNAALEARFGRNIYTDAA